MTSIAMRVVRFGLRLKGDKRTARSAEAVFAHAAKVQAKGPAQPPSSLYKDAYISSTEVDGVAYWTVAPRANVAARAKASIFYIHGSGYTAPMVSFHWQLVRDLLRRTGAVIHVPQYPMAPDHTIDDVLPTLVELYLRQDENLPRLLMGDSAGGALALAVAQQLAERQLPQPKRLILIAPWLDASLTNPKVAEVDKRDPMLGSVGLKAAAQAWSGSRSIDDPLVSPLHADYAQLAPVDIVVGTADLLHPDAEVLAETAKAKGWPVTVHTYDGGFHVFPALPWLPESKEALSLMADLIKRTPA
ncbi:alpha/beta hydrolase fold domain-containing protein [Williamsia sp. CHRR-6]|uniref:alpha/beta hydrolase fold domain-containing protein n=1 Tax=Williamsia sp. CHRR-6 TaxID=2835871 RepID=UPI001BDA876F|nr:alpha/beta hydrolase [Williamsia sp. CHRR-6]MBT0567033.1 alpha/beta hydrolase fold domain-containing protein [Williamsia sp. CHRR-6]